MDSITFLVDYISVFLRDTKEDNFLPANLLHIANCNFRICQHVHWVCDTQIITEVLRIILKTDFSNLIFSV